MFSPPTSTASRRSISLPESVGGLPLFDWLDGPTIAPPGPDRVPASHSAPRASAGALPTPDTSGPKCAGSSPSAALQASLESKLQARMGATGSPEYVLTWKRWDMQSGPPICALRALGRRTSDSGCSGWPMPCAMAMNVGADPEKHMARLARLKAKHGNGNGAGLTLGMACNLVAGWPMPMAGSPGTDTYNPAGNNDSSRKTVALATGWATPRASDAEKASGMSIARRASGKALDTLLDQVKATTGRAPDGSPALTEKRGALNPAFSLWLMGYPAAWLFAAPLNKPVPRHRSKSTGTAASARSGE